MQKLIISVCAFILVAVLSASQLVIYPGATPSVLQAGLLAEYRFNDGSGTQLTDYSVNASHGALGGGGCGTPTWTAQGLSFSGTHCVTIPISVWNNSKTIMLFFRIRDPYLNQGQLDWIIASGDSAGGNWIGLAHSVPALMEYRVAGTYNSGGNLPSLGYSSWSLVLSNPNAIYLNGVAMPGYKAQGVTTSTTAATTKAVLGSWGANTAFGFFGDIYYAVFYSTALTASQIAANELNVENILKQRGITIEDATANSGQLVFDGDSITESTNLMSVQSTWEYLVMLSFPGVQWHNLGISGQLISSMLPAAPTRIDTIFQRYQLGPKVTVIWGGTNDLNGSVAPATIYTNLQSYCTARRNAGQKVVVITTLPRSSSNGNFENDRQTYNSSIRSGFGAATLAADAIADVGQDPTMGVAGAQNNATNYSSSLHPTATGHTFIAPTIAEAIHQVVYPHAPFWHKITIPFTSLTAAATTQALAVHTLAPNQKVCGAVVKHSTAFSGSAIASMTVSLGDVAGSATDYTAAFDVFQAVSATAKQDTPLMRSITAALSTVQANFTSTGANVNAVTTGSLVIDLCTVIP